MAGEDDPLRGPPLSGEHAADRPGNEANLHGGRALGGAGGLVEADGRRLEEHLVGEAAPRPLPSRWTAVGRIARRCILREPTEEEPGVLGPRIELGRQRTTAACQWQGSHERGERCPFDPGVDQLATGHPARVVGRQGERSALIEAKDVGRRRADIDEQSAVTLGHGGGQPCQDMPV